MSDLKLQENKQNSINFLSTDVRYEKYINKMKKAIPNLKKNVLLFLLINEKIDEDGLWLEFGEGKFNNTNYISQYSKNTVYSFKENVCHKNFNKNVEIVKGPFSKTISQFKETQFSNEESKITLLCINNEAHSAILQILSNLYEKISDNCVIVFTKFVNFQKCEGCATKAFYEFVQLYNIKYEWIGMDGSVSKNEVSNFDGFLNTNNECVAIRITHNPNFNIYDDGEITDKFDYTNFDWEKYIENYSDLKDIKTKQKAWGHWKKYGMHEGRTFFTIKNEEENLFDWEKYKNTYEDLRHLDSKESAWKHWSNHGVNEGRSYFSTNKDEELNFDWEKYKSTYEDLSGINTKELAWEHWLNYGKKEGRPCFLLETEKMKRTTSKLNIENNFDWIFYLEKNKDLSQIKDEAGALEHWNLYGKSENRVCTFDWYSYISNLNLDSHNLHSKEEAYKHWINNGKKEYEIPGNFMWLSYLIKNPDLQALIMSENDAKYHWLNFGQCENRSY